MDVQGRQPAVTPAGRVDTLDAIEIKYFAARLLGMPADDCLARLVAGSLLGFQHRPTQQVSRLGHHWKAGIKVGVHKNMAVGFQVIPTLGDELQVIGWNIAYRSAKTIREDRRDAPGVAPEATCVFGNQRGHQHFLVIPAQADQAALAFQLDQAVDHGLGIPSVVDEIAEDHDRIIDAGRDYFQQRIQGEGASMNVTYRDQSILTGHSFHRY